MARKSPGDLSIVTYKAPVHRQVGAPQYPDRVSDVPDYWLWLLTAPRLLDAIELASYTDKEMVARKFDEFFSLMSGCFKDASEILKNPDNIRVGSEQRKLKPHEIVKLREYIELGNPRSGASKPNESQMRHIGQVNKAKEAAESSETGRLIEDLYDQHPEWKKKLKTGLPALDGKKSAAQDLMMAVALGLVPHNKRWEALYAAERVLGRSRYQSYLMSLRGSLPEAMRQNLDLEPQRATSPSFRRPVYRRRL